MQDIRPGSQGAMGRRSFLLAAAVSPVLLAGCQGKSGDPVEAASFPVTLPHAFGETTINTVPQRIATLGYASHDVCIALGVVPAAVPQYELRGFGTSIWFNKAITTMNAVMPMQYRDSDEPPLQQLEDLKPDLILAVNSGITAKQYKQLSEIAPVVAYPGIPFGTDWRTTTTTVGAAIGRPDAARNLIREVEDGIAKAVSGYDHLSGSTFLYLGVSLAPGADFEIYDADSNPVRILQEFGVVPAPVLDRVVAEGTRRPLKTGPAPVLWEARRAGELEADIHVASVSADKKIVVEDGVLDGLPGSRRNDLVLVKTTDDALALIEASPLGVKWATLNVLPELARAAYEANRRR